MSKKKRATPLSVLMRDPRMLKQHPLNVVIYGEDIPPQLEDSIRNKGIRDPLVVCKSSDPELDNVIVSGRRRRNIAIKLDIKSVPIYEWPCEDKLIFEEQLLLMNVRAELTVEQRTRMYNRLLEIDQALRSDEGNVLPHGAEPKTPAKPPKSKDEAARQSGLSRRTAERASTAVAVADTLKESGQEEQAAEILHELNNGSVNGAARKAEEIAHVVPASGAVVNAESQLISKEIQKLRKAITQAAELVGVVMKAIDAKNLASKPFMQRFRKFENRMTTLHSAMEDPKKIVGLLEKDWLSTLKELGNE